MKKLSIVIPVFNEEATLEALVRRVYAVNLGDIGKEVILVDDYSTDSSASIIQKLKKEHNDLIAIFKDCNSGKGATLREGFGHTTGDYVIVQDADLEYDPEDYNKLIAQIYDGETDVVYGSRFSGDYKDMTNLHYFGNKLLTLFTNLLFGVKLTDMETCYKLIPGDFIRKLQIKSDRFNFEPEITAKILKSGLTITEVPISYAGRTHLEGKKITWRDGLSALTTLIYFKFWN